MHTFRGFKGTWLRICVPYLSKITNSTLFSFKFEKNKVFHYDGVEYNMIKMINFVIKNVL